MKVGSARSVGKPGTFALALALLCPGRDGGL